MLRNIIFDMGGVMTEFNPEYFVDCLGLTGPGDRELLLREVFRSEEWVMQDAGAIDEAETERRVLVRLPERLHAAAHQMIFEWDRLSRPVPGMADLVRDCKAAGLGVYLLSNASVRQPEYWPDIPGSEWFDGAVISALERCVKPMPEIYRRLLDRYGLDPADCVFIDDGQPNVDAAIRLGMRGICFSGDTDALRRALFDL